MKKIDRVKVQSRARDGVVVQVTYMHVSLWKKMALVMMLATAQASSEEAMPTAFSGANGVSLYGGMALAQLGRSTQHQAYAYGNTAGGTFDDGEMRSSGKLTAAVGGLKFGGEWHIGMYLGSNGIGIGLETFCATRADFYPRLSMQISGVLVEDQSFSSWHRDMLRKANAAQLPLQHEELKMYVGLWPDTLSYGIRVMPTLLFSGQDGAYAGIYASIGYGIQEFAGVIEKSWYTDVFGERVLSREATAFPADEAESSMTFFRTTLSGLNYGIGGSIYFGPAWRVYSFLELQQLDQRAEAGGRSGTVTQLVAQGVDAQDGAVISSHIIAAQLRTLSLGFDHVFL